MVGGNGAGDGGGRGGGQTIVWRPKTVPHPLTISPNLDALLEYDEKVRGPSSPPVASPTMGLPPPPRRHSRKPRSPTSPKVRSPLIQEASSGWTEEENPYINPGPMLAAARPGPETGGAGGQRSVPVDQSQQATKKRLLGLRVGKRSRSFSLFKGTQQPREMPASDDLVLDIRRHSTDSSQGLDTLRRSRPLLSHARPSSVASSSYSSTTYTPASTIDARISISSAMVPSLADSHFTDEPLPIVPPSRSSSLHSHQSFIDIASPPPRSSDQPRSSDRPRSPPRSSSDRRSTSADRPPTTNFLDLGERSDLIRKNRKLAQLFGQPPGSDVFPTTTKPPVLPMILPVDHFTDSRRHSLPLTSSSDLAQDQYRPSSPTSFIDLSDDPLSATLHTPKLRISSAASPTTRGRPRRPSSPSAQSLFESMTPEEQAEESRKRKREKLAKLHRFLGSRVPANLVLGPDAPNGPALPPLDPAIMVSVNDNQLANRKDWLRRRRSSSAAAYTSSWSDEIDRIKEDLNSTEKAINVRRAHKMEKVFGVAPPQTLYHTRRSPSPSITHAAAFSSAKMISGWTSPGESHPPFTGTRNPNRSSYTKAPKKSKSKDNRPGTSESNKALLPKNRSDSGEPDVRKRASVVYSHYQESLNSLTDIIDRDDRESLAELHEYLNSGDMSLPPPLQSFTRSPTTPTALTPVSSDRRLSNASSIKSERRRSLPARTSIISIGSEYTISTPRPDVTDFQARRRRAAKLTQFFGVDYRELITDVLESIETGLEAERKRGTLNPEEVETLGSWQNSLPTSPIEQCVQDRYRWSSWLIEAHVSTAGAIIHCTRRSLIALKLADSSLPAQALALARAMASPFLSANASDDEYTDYNFDDLTEEDLRRVDAHVEARLGEPKVTIELPPGPGPGPGSSSEETPVSQRGVSPSASEFDHEEGDAGVRRKKREDDLDRLADSPLARHRRNGVLSVTDLASLAWCEVQFDYGLRQRRSMPIASRPQSFVSAQGKTIVVAKEVAVANDKITKQGKALHRALEREVKPEEFKVDISSPEEVWALR
ncbi:hypothetical protein H0H87_006417 [Tephrocybe sp. NHM501043]|nr:hypothetical protein H0H87_006417 [Tephrocybe sp. NHM501043]